MDCLIRFTQSHESFRLAEIQALAILEGIKLEVLDYKDESPFCIVRVRDAKAARALVRRSILTQAVYELWGTSPSGLYDELHADVRERAKPLWGPYEHVTFKFDIDAYQHTRPMEERTRIMESFTYLPLEGVIELRNPEETFVVLEDWPLRPPGAPPFLNPLRIHFGRFLGAGSRDLCRRYDLKKRSYISTTSMDSELALVTANMTLAEPGKLFYDPFVGTGSFPIAAAHFGALAFGSDIDGRSFRGSGAERSLRGNFSQYGLGSRAGDFFTADLTHTPLKARRWLDGIMCDPPYGVREGLKVLGRRGDGPSQKVDYGWKSPGYIPPKKPYSFLAMLDDILEFATQMLVDNGRISFWMPTANDSDQEIDVPTHPCLELVSLCVQPFNKWSRRLITYRRIPDGQVNKDSFSAYRRTKHVGRTADELNPFRDIYFKGFKKEET